VNRRNALAGHDLLAVEVADPDVANLARFLKLHHGFHGGLEGSLAVGPMNLVEIDSFQPQSVEALIDFLQDPSRTRIPADVLLFIPFQGALGGNHQPVGCSPFPQGLPDNLLCFTKAVHRCGVDKIDAGLKSSQDGFERVALIGTAPCPPACDPGAQSEHGNLEIGLPESNHIHGFSTSVAWVGISHSSCCKAFSLLLRNFCIVKSALQLVCFSVIKGSPNHTVLTSTRSSR